MKERQFSFGIYYGLPRRGETPAVTGAKFLHSLDALSRIDPLFTNWNVLDLPAMDTLPLAAARRDPRFLLISGKGGKERLVPLSEPGRAALARYLECRDRFLPEGRPSRWLSC